MGYADNVHSTARPSCWGNALSYDPNDIECSECRFRHSCDVGVNGGGRRVPVNTPYYKPAQPRSRPVEEGEAGVNQPAVIGPDEKPIERFAKDALSGGLRGLFYEMWQFWRHYRIR